MAANGTTDSNDRSAEGEDVLTDSLVVFQCESCRSIIGDATNWIAATEPLEAFTLSAVTEAITKGDKLQLSTAAYDAGSSYFVLSCRLCKSELGRCYSTTPSHLDYLRDNFTIFVSKVTSYQLGSAGVKARSEFKGQELPVLLEVAQRTVKIQHLLVALNDRLCSVEQCLSANHEEN